VSDTQGALCIGIRDDQCVVRYRHGLGIAEFVLCGNCGVLVAAALHGDSGSLHATANARAVDGWTQFGARQPVSPKTLSAGERVKRWQSLWFPNVNIVIGKD